MAKYWYPSVREINAYMISPQNFKFWRQARAFILARLPEYRYIVAGTQRLFGIGIYLGPGDY